MDAIYRARLYAVVLLCFVSYGLLAWQRRDGKQSSEMWAWAGALVLLMLLNISSELRHQSGLYADYQ
jgi:hypothetical protein